MAVLRSVAKTDTFEKQRQVINQIAQDLFDQVGAGDTDLAAGNIKLGDGTVLLPSLSFTSQNTLGVYKPEANTFAITANGDVAYFSDNIEFFKTFRSVQKSLTTSGSSISNSGQNYDQGTYTDVSLSGGFGFGATADLTVEGLVGTLSTGANYEAGTFTDALLVGGNGVGATCSFDVENISGTITDPGSGYTDGVFPVNFTVISGTGSLAAGEVQVVGGEVTVVAFTDQGRDYTFGTILSTSDLSGGSGFEFTINNNPGQILNFSITSDGDKNYQIGNNLTLVGNLSKSINSNSTDTFVVDSTDGILDFSSVTGSFVPADTFITSIDRDTNTIIISQPLTSSGTTTVTFQQPYLKATSSGFSFSLTDIGIVTSFAINNGGSGYEIGDVLEVNSLDLIQPIENKLEVLNIQSLNIGSQSASLFSVGGEFQDSGASIGPYPIIRINTSGSNITTLDINIGSGSVFGDGLPIVYLPSGNNYTASGDPVVNLRYSIDGTITPSLSLYKDSLYSFDYTSTSANPYGFYLSTTPDGSNTSVSENGVTITQGSDELILSDTSSLYEGMEIAIVSGNGSFPSGTIILSIDSATNITMSSPASSTGIANVSFNGIEYTSPQIYREGDYYYIQPNESTPSTLYYYSAEASGLGDGATLGINLNNPKTFGSNFQLSVSNIQISDLLQSNVLTGTTTISDLSATNGFVETGLINDLESNTILVNGSINTPNITNTNSVTLTSPTFIINANLNVGGGDLTYTDSTQTLFGRNLTTEKLQVDTNLFIDNNKIYTTSSNNLELESPAGRIIRCYGGGLQIPAGNTSQRPSIAQSTLGTIRFNTETTSYEGYLGTDDLNNPIWSSLGGVKDIDGNTYIIAEETTGKNDNTLWFVNDDQTSLKLTNEFLEFIYTQKIRSLDPALPLFTEWSPNTGVISGEYLKYRNDLFLVTSSGSTGSSSTPPNDTTGAVFTNGTASLQWVQNAVRDLIFTEIDNVRIGPLKNVPLIISNEIKILDNDISSLSQDLYIEPAADKKVVINAPTSLVIPSGGTGARGIPSQGSIRYNTSITQFEGYNGSSWSSLGGVRDVDGDTYIAPELTPNGDQDTLYFVNQDIQTLQITTTAFNFGEVDTIQSSVTNQLNVSVADVTFGDSGETSLNHNDNGLFTDRVYLSTTKANLELGVSAGLTNRPMFRINEAGEFQSNALALTADLPYWVTFTNIIGSTLQQRDFGYTSNRFELVKDTNNSFNVNLYDNQLIDSCVVEIQAHILDGSYNKEYIQFVVTDNKTNILYNEISSLQTGPNLISNLVFEFENPNLSGATLGNIRVTGSLDTNITTGTAVRFVILKRAINNVALL